MLGSSVYLLAETCRYLIWLRKENQISWALMVERSRNTKQKKHAARVEYNINIVIDYIQKEKTAKSDNV